MIKISQSSFSKNKKTRLAMALSDIFMLTLGVCLFVWADKVTSFISIALGTLFVIYSLYLLVAYLREKPEERSGVVLVPSLALLIAGGFLILQHDFIKELISFVVGAFLIIKSIVGIQDAMHAKAFFRGFLTPLVLSMIGLLCGVLCIAGKLVVPDLLLQIIGAIIVVFAVVDLVASLILGRAQKLDTAGAKAARGSEAIEAEVVKEEKA